MAQSSRPRRGVRTRQSARTGVLEVFVRPQQSVPARILGLLLRMRAELFMISVLAIGYIELTSIMPEWAVYTLVIVLVVGIACVPASRRYVVCRFWCVVTRHRVRCCFEQTRTMTHLGKLPHLVWARPTPVGERVRVWLPAGLSVKDVENISDNLATACWARSARIERDRRQAAVVLVHIIRRDPLASTELAPDVLDQVEPVVSSNNVVPLPTREEVVRELHEPRVKSSERKSQRVHAESDAKPKVEGFGGMDVTDYV